MFRISARASTLFISNTGSWKSKKFFYKASNSLLLQLLIRPELPFSFPHRDFIFLAAPFLYRHSIRLAEIYNKGGNNSSLKGPTDDRLHLKQEKWENITCKNWQKVCKDIKKFSFFSGACVILNRLDSIPSAMRSTCDTISVQIVSYVVYTKGLCAATGHLYIKQYYCLSLAWRQKHVNPPVMTQYLLHLLAVGWR